MNELLATYTLLADAMLDDPLLSLANAVVWLDPLWKMPGDYEYEEGDDAEMALYVTRGVFPDIYAGAVECIRGGATYGQLDSYICAEVNKIGIPLDNLEYMAYGIPMLAHGVELSNPEFHTSRPDLARILALFGIHPEADEWRVDVPDGVYMVGHVIANSLMNQQDECWQKVGWMLAWLFSCTGNSLIDCDDEALAEMEPLMWDEENVAFAIEIIEEADGVLKDVDAGLNVLETHPEAFRALSKNVTLVCRKLANRKEKYREPHVRLEWPSLDRGADGTAVAGVELLQLRRDADEA